MNVIEWNRRQTTALANLMVSGFTERLGESCRDATRPERREKFPYPVLTSVWIDLALIMRTLPLKVVPMSEKNLAGLQQHFDVHYAAISTMTCDASGTRAMGEWIGIQAAGPVNTRQPLPLLMDRRLATLPETLMFLIEHGGKMNDNTALYLPHVVLELEADPKGRAKARRAVTIIRRSKDREDRHQWHLETLLPGKAIDCRFFVLCTYD